MRQAVWERRRLMVRLRDLGYAIKDIAGYFRVSREHVSATMRTLSTRSPVEEWLAEADDILVLARRRKPTHTVTWACATNRRRRFGSNY